MSNETFGLLIRQHNRHGSEYLVAELVMRNEEGKIRNPSDWFNYTRPKHMHDMKLEGLRMEGFVTEYGEPEFIGFKPRYKDLYSVELSEARRMVKTLSKIEAHAIKTSARECGDWFTSLCAALKLTFVVEYKNEHPSSSYDDNQFYWMTVSEGRNRYRQLANEMVEDARRAKAEAVTA